MTADDPRPRRLEPEPWMADASCRTVDPEAFFPASGDNQNATVKKVCQACPVMLDCQRYALKNEEAHGIWGGLTVREREDLLGKRLGAIDTVDHAERKHKCPDCDDGRLFTDSGLSMHRHRKHPEAA